MARFRASTPRNIIATGVVAGLVVVGALAEAVAALTGTFSPIDLAVSIVLAVAGVAGVLLAATWWRDQGR